MEQQEQLALEKLNHAVETLVAPFLEMSRPLLPSLWEIYAKQGKPLGDSEEGILMWLGDIAVEKEFPALGLLRVILAYTKQFE
jgi:hypothetical protein